MTSANLDKRQYAQNRLVKDPSGWPAAQRANATLTADAGTRIFSINPNASPGVATYYIHGVPRDITWPTNRGTQWGDVEGTWFFYLDTNGALIATQDSTAWVTALLGDGALVASLYWDATNKARFAFCEERHGFMQGDIHLEMHNAFGTQWVSGGVLTDINVAGNGSLATHAQLGVSTVTIYDEDIRLTFSNGTPQTLTAPSTIPVYYRSGASGVWRRKTPDVYPFIYSGTAGYTGANARVPYNSFLAGTWALTQLADQDFVLIHIYATNDIEYPIIAIQGQVQYATLAAAQTGITTELLGLSAIIKTLAIEATPLGSLVLQSRSSYTNVPKARWQPANAAGAAYIDFRGNTFRGGTSSGVTAHGGLSGLANDDHLQYALLAGRAGGQSLVGGTAASENLTLQSTANATRGSVAIVDPIALTPIDPSTVANAEGKVMYDSVEHTLAVQLAGGAVTLQVGQEEHVRCVNKTASPIDDGQVVYVSGAQGNRPTITLASAASDTAASDAVGVTTEPIAVNAEGYVTVRGVVNGYDTHLFTAGDVLYLSSTTPGGLQNTKPTGTAVVVPIGIALNSTVSGKILVQFLGISHLADLHDVNVGTPTAGALLSGNGTSWTANTYWLTATGTAVPPAFGTIRVGADENVITWNSGGTNYRALTTASIIGGVILGDTNVPIVNVIAQTQASISTAATGITLNANGIALGFSGVGTLTFTNVGFNLGALKAYNAATPTAGTDLTTKAYVDNPVVISPAQLTGSQNNYNPTGFDGAGILRLSSDASRDITGFLYTVGNAPILNKQVTNVGTFPIILRHASGSSSAANRIYCPSGVDYTLYDGESVDIWYDVTTAGWRLTADMKNAGSLVDPTYLPEATPSLVHLHFDSSYVDVAPFPIGLTKSGTTNYDTGDKKFGAASWNINDNLADYAYIDHGGLLNMGSDDWTMECWAKINGVSASGGGRNIFCYFSDTAGNDQQGPLFFCETTQVPMVLNNFYTAGGWAQTTPFSSSMATLGYGTWRHFAFWRWQGRHFFSVDGVLAGPLNDQRPIYFGPRLWIGRHPTVGGGGTFNGRMDEFRIYRGAPYKAAAFTPKTRAYYDATNLPGGNYGDLRVDGTGGAFICHGGTKWKQVKNF